MKTIAKQTLKSLLLISALLGGAVFASDDNSSNSSDSSSSSESGGDLTLLEHASALINYSAAQAMKKFQYDEKLRLQPAPGTNWSLSAGAVAGANLAGLSLDISNKSLIYSLSGMTSAENITINQTSYPVAQTQATGPLQLYQQMESFFKDGDATNLASFNAAPILQSDNLTTSQITPEQAQNFINMLTNPFPSADEDSTVQAKLKGQQELTGQEMEDLANQLAQYVIISVSTNALSDIIARRTPIAGNEQQQSVMEIMTQFNKQRFANPDWYNMLGTASDAAIAREIAHMQAYQIWLNTITFKNAETQTALLAALVSVMGDMSKTMIETRNQLAAAQAQGKAQSSQLQQQLKDKNLDYQNNNPTD